jgi:AcrR family transcriptional regulator
MNTVRLSYDGRKKSAEERVMAERERDRSHAPRAQLRKERASDRVRPSERRSRSEGTRTSLTLDTILARTTTILDEDGIDGLTLRRLARELNAAVASVYWYVDDKDELLRLAYEATAGPPVRALLEHPIDPAAWREGLRAASIAVFEIIEAHPWVAEAINGADRGWIVALLWDRIGQLLSALGLPDVTAFYAGTALMGLISVSGVSALYGARSDEDRDTRLSHGAGEFAALDPDEYPFISRTISTYRHHTEREQFLGGLDIVLDGIAARLPA